MTGENKTDSTQKKVAGLKFWQQLAPAIVALISAVLVAYVSNEHGKDSAKQELQSQTNLIIRVYDSVSNAGIEQADMILRLPNGENQPAKADSTGQHTFVVPADSAGEMAELRVSKGAYSGKSFEVRIPKGTSTKDYYLDPSPSANVRTLNASANSPTDNRPAPPTGLTATVYDNSTSPASVIEVSAPAEEIQQITTSGPKPSGTSDSFSPWYVLCSSPAPQGYKIFGVEFKLSGDRTCGAWAECQQVSRTDQNVCYWFRMQGHSELRSSRGQKGADRLDPTQGLSSGVLKVTYRNK